MIRISKILIVFAAISSLIIIISSKSASGRNLPQERAGRKQADPASWGGNHAGRPVPEYVQGDECLFCHRYDIGVTWQKNAHGVAIRQVEDAPELVKVLESLAPLAPAAKDVKYFMGSRHRIRFLKKEGYGKFSILNAQAILSGDGRASAVNHEKLNWEKDKFGDRCAGCHSTGVDSKERTFSGFGLDCYVCHGNADLNHSNDTALMLLSKKRRNDAKVITSLCAQCHLRESKSKSTGLPYPNAFIAGDNLFQDLDVDWSKADDEKLNPGDRHIWKNVRDVALNGNESITCLNCHQIHANTSIRHRRVLRAPICSECHLGDGFKEVRKYTVQSALCEY